MVFPHFMAVTCRSKPFLIQTSCFIYWAGYVNVMIMCLLCTKECLARRPSRLLKSSSAVNGLLHNAWGNSGGVDWGEDLWGAGWMPEPLTLTVAANVLSSFSHETPAPVWCKRRQWKGQWQNIGSTFPCHHSRHFGLCLSVHVCPSDCMLIRRALSWERQSAGNERSTPWHIATHSHKSIGSSAVSEFI